MAAPLVNTNRSDPYRTFRFQVHFDGEAVAGLSKMSVLNRSTKVAEWVPTGDPMRQGEMPGDGTKYEQIMMQQGLTHDFAFTQWANLVNDVGSDGAILGKHRKNLVINVLNLQGTVATSCKVFRAWVSEFLTQPNVESTVFIQTLRIEHEGWQRDSTFGGPTET
jgi:phage tail-like protein